MLLHPRQEVFTLNTCTGIRKPKGVSNEFYSQWQEKKCDAEFHEHVNTELQKLVRMFDDAHKALAEVRAQQNVLKLETRMRDSDDIGAIWNRINTCFHCLADLKTAIAQVEVDANDSAKEHKEFAQKSSCEKDFFALHALISAGLIAQKAAAKDVEDEMESLKSNLDRQLSQMRQQVRDIPSNIPEIKEWVEQQFELEHLAQQKFLVQVDANERRLKFAEKKLDVVMRTLNLNS